MTYDAGGNQLTVRDPNSVGADIGNLGYSWDANKNKTAETIAGVMSGYGFTAAGTTYDSEDRLSGYRRAATSGTAALAQTWSLTSVGDWSSVTTNGTAVTRTHGPTHELLTSGGQSVTTDVKGNQTVLPSSLTSQASSLFFSWDFDNKMKSSDIDANGSADVTFEYDALGRRVARTQGSTALVYFQADQQTIADYPRGGAASTATYRYVFGSYIDEPVVRKTTGTGGTVLYYHRNQQYSIYALTNSTGVVQERYAYTAYGQPTFLNASATVQTSSAAGNRYTYTAREWDATLGLHHFRARWMSRLTGRFLTRDPIGYTTGWNYYLYGNARPVAEVDPSGNSSISGSHGISLCGSSASAPYIDPVDVVNGNPVIDNKEVIGSLYASASVDATESPAECGKNTYLHVSFFGSHDKVFNPLNGMKVHQNDFSTTACSHSSSAEEKWVQADWNCPIRCDKAAGKCEDYVFSSIVYMSQGKPPSAIYFTRPGQMIAIEATVSFSGSYCKFGCVVEIQVCQLLGYGVPNNHTDPPPTKEPRMGAAAKGACKKWSNPRK
ncbi:MAG: RHS repeat-associated core domain-containing protein [Planctomycetota bacterium]|nr:RHS repeat-associated core domain-containing protein [Planctomycetota bacterium]